MCGRRGAENIANLAGRGSQHFDKHCVILAGASDASVSPLGSSRGTTVEFNARPSWTIQTAPPSDIPSMFAPGSKR